MNKHVLPMIGDLRVDEMGREDVLRILTPIWTTKPEVARKQRNRICAVLSWCQTHGFIEHNVAGEMIDGALPPMPQVKQDYRIQTSFHSLQFEMSGISRNSLGSYLHL